MDLTYVELVSRWLHVLSAVTLLGGAIFSRFVLLPSAAELSASEHDKLRAGVLARWKKFVHLGVGVLLLTGFFNFVRAIPGHKGIALYHPLIGVKILLAFVVFFLASAMVGRSSLADSLRKHARFWTGLIVVLGITIVVISGYAKVMLPAHPVATAPAK